MPTGPVAQHSLKVNADITSRVTYSTILKKLTPDDMNDFITSELDQADLPHNTFTQEALGLVIRSSDGILPKARNLCLSCMIEGVRSRQKTIDNVNRVLIQPHWRMEQNIEHII